MFRHGQWVKFAVPVPKAHTAADGRTVGIYQRATKDPITQREVPAQVIAVKPDGTNVRLLNDEDRLGLAAFDPVTLPDLVPITDKADLPPGRVVAPDYQPRP